jgi:hypothetical protein
MVKKSRVRSLKPYSRLIPSKEDIYAGVVNGHSSGRYQPGTQRVAGILGIVQPGRSRPALNHVGYGLSRQGGADFAVPGYGTEGLAVMQACGGLSNLANQ